MGNRTAIFVHLGASASRDQQERVCLEYCTRRHYTATDLVFHPADALQLVKDGLVDLVVCAYEPTDRASIVDLVTKAGGRVEEARPGPAIQRDLGRMIGRLFERGMTVGEIADVADVPTGEVRRFLFRHRKG